jgi:uncharacterized membrane protein
MAKYTKGNKQTALVHGNKSGAQVEQYESVDDGLLPDADELVKYKALDPTIIDWIKERAEKEQEMRHRFMDNKMAISNSALNKGFILDITILIISLAVLSGGMVFSYLLISQGKAIAASLFGGGALLFAVNSILNFRKAVSNSKKVAPSKSVIK